MLDKKILLFLKLPPPLTGATLINKFVAESSIIKSSFKTCLIYISYKQNIEDTGFFSITKVLKILSLYFILLFRIIQFNPQIVYFQISPLGLAFYRDCTYVLIMKLFRKHIVYHIHGKGIDKYIGTSNLKKLIYRWAFKNTSVICLSELLFFDIERIYDKKPYVVPNAIVPSRQTPAKISKEKVFTILFLSNLIVSKGIIVFLDAMSVLKQNGIRFQAKIVGKEVELSGTKLQRQIELHGISDCVFYEGAKYGIDKDAFIINADVLVYPTLEDVWGLVILEAMQFGIPVIASREGAIPEIVEHGVNGFIVGKSNPKEIATMIEKLIINPKLREQMGKAGREKFLANYTIDIFERNMKNVFEEILNSKINRRSKDQ
jgi:glycosyltransferase involved in cell wall biosynthesis